MHRHLARVTPVALAVVVAFGMLIGSAAPVAACSCVGPQPMRAYAGDPDQVIFTGTVGVPDARGVPVRVTRWFQSPDTPRIVWLEANGFGGDGASCGTALPPAGSEWIFVAYRTDRTELGVNLCTPHAAAGAAEGQAMFADAVATFGQGRVMDPEPDPPGTPTPESLPRSMPLLVALAVGLIALIGGLAFVVFGARRRRTDEV